MHFEGSTSVGGEGAHGSEEIAFSEGADRLPLPMVLHVPYRQ